MSKYRVLTVFLILFSAIESVIAVSMITRFGGPVQSTQSGLLGFFWQYSIPLSLLGWTCASVSFIRDRYGRRSQIKSLFAKKGFNGKVYDLMIGMRGAESRMALLKGMQEPRIRQELANITGIDWKEVDRQVSVMERYGLVKVYAQSGTVTMYRVTELGKMLLNFIEELHSTHP
jgi:DNA-binding MarR family transcriptional regulator